MVNTLKNNYWLWIIFAVFIFTRFLGLDQIYHQDEYRWASIANPVFGDLSSPHPPLSEFLYKLAGRVFGFDYLRIVPFVFSFLNLVLIYLISLEFTKNKKIALIAAGFFTINIYSLIANLQIDIDGAILPFFILLSYYAYLHILDGRNRKKWLMALGFAVVGGFLTKLSFLLFIGALIIDQALRICYLKGKNLKQIFNRLWLWLVGFLALGLLFYYFYASNFGKVVEYAEHFQSLNFASRAYFDMTFKIFKSFVWLSPFLALPVLYSLFRKDLFRKYRLWFIYLFLNLIFYLVLFDFSTLTIERYFMFFIIPSVLIGAEAIFDMFKGRTIRRKAYILSAIVFILFFLWVLSLPHDVLPLNPKIEYVNHVRSLNFNFLIPLTGGSGPAGFYVSAQFVLWFWVLSSVFMAVVFYKKFVPVFLILFVVFGLGYNLILMNEYLFGGLYGSVPAIAKESVDYIAENPDIKEVITYYDIGAYYLQLSGKYSSRFYTAPTRDYTPKIESYRGHYLIVDFPAIDKNGRYWPLISRCPLLKKFQDKKIESYIFDCSKI